MKAKFTELARFAPHLIKGDSKKVKKFLPGLRLPIRSKLVPLLLNSYREGLGGESKAEKSARWNTGKHA
jgi:hypothetical protein